MKASTIVEQIEIPAWVVELEAASLYAVLQGVKDLRKRRGRRYEAGLLLVLILLAKLAGMKTIAGVAEWVQLRGEWLSRVLGWSQLRFPCANPYRYLCEQIDVAEMNQVLGAFFAQLYAASGKRSRGGPGGASRGGTVCATAACLGRQESARHAASMARGRRRRNKSWACTLSVMTIWCSRWRWPVKAMTERLVSS
ncbi:MAG TPA: transposase family protein [Caldilineaceae bacterium]|nr:transposase family protein [Caldilineaceae bacterium]